MYDMVYLHKTARASSLHLKSIFQRAEQLARENLLAFCSLPLRKSLLKQHLETKDKIALDDNDVWFHIKEWATSSDQILSNLCNDFLRRRLYKVFRVDNRTYEILEKLDSAEFGHHLATLVSLRMGCKPEDAGIFYHFDAPQFNAVGRAPDNPLETVWLMREGKYGHWFESLHQYWQDNYPTQETLDRKYFSLIVHPNCVNDVKKLIDRVSLRCFPNDPPSAPPTPYKILGALGREGAHKTAFLGASSEPGSAQNSIVALKRINPQIPKL